MKVQILGSGDAFGSGGRLNTCFSLRGRETNILVDCGASAMVSIRRFDVDPNAIDAIVISHLHGDHFGGLPFFILDAQLVSKRQSKLIIAGPSGIGTRLQMAMEVFFPGASKAKRVFELEVIELVPLKRKYLSSELSVTAFEVNHPSGAPALSLRIECEGKTIAYSGDTDWVDSLKTAASHADLFIAEAYCFERKLPFHLDYRTLASKMPEVQPRKLILTHMSADMLARVGEADFEAAYDGMTIELED